MKFQTGFWLAAARVAIISWVSAIGAHGQDGKKSPDGLKFHSLKFYEHGVSDLNTSNGATEGEGAEKKYASHFPLSETRFIGGQIVFKNLWQGQKEVVHEVTMGLYSYDNQLVSVNKKRMVVSPDWKFAWASQSYGWTVAGRWSAGTYRVKVWLGNDKVGESAFYLDDDQKKLPITTAGLSLGELEFYEGGGFFRPGPAEKSGTRLCAK